MFDIGFWELLLIGAVGLLVIGPERLPTVATLTGQWVGRIRRYGRHMHNEIQQELESEHLKQVLEKQNSEMESLRREMGDTRRQAGELLKEPGRDRGSDAGQTPETGGQGSPTQDKDQHD